MVTNEATGLGRGRLTAGGSELAQVVLVGHAGQPGQEVAQGGERVLAVALAEDDQRVEDVGSGGCLRRDQGGVPSGRMPTLVVGWGAASGSWEVR